VLRPARILRWKRVDAALRRREAPLQEIRKLRMALEQSPATVVVTGLDGTIQYVNAAFQALTGYSSQEAVGMNTRELKSGLHGQAFYRELWQTIQENSTTARRTVSCSGKGRPSRRCSTARGGSPATWR